MCQRSDSALPSVATIPIASTEPIANAKLTAGPAIAVRNSCIAFFGMEVRLAQPPKSEIVMSRV